MTKAYKSWDWEFSHLANTELLNYRIVHIFVLRMNFFAFARAKNIPGCGHLFAYYVYDNATKLREKPVFIIQFSSRNRWKVIS